MAPAEQERDAGTSRETVAYGEPIAAIPAGVEARAAGATSATQSEAATRTVTGTVVSAHEEREPSSLRDPSPDREVARGPERAREERSPRAPSAWSRLPDADELGLAAREVGRAAGRVATRVGGTMREGASLVARGVGAGLDHAGSALAVPSSADLEGLLADTNLPELSGDDALYDLARRLDHEADLFRGLALRAIARAQWADRIALGVSLLCAFGGAALAIVCGVGALFGAQASSGRIGLAFAAMGVLLLGAVAVFAATLSTRTAQRTLAREALSRADLAELRISRVAALLALRVEDPARFRDALARLERDASAPVR